MTTPRYLQNKDAVSRFFIGLAVKYSKKAILLLILICIKIYQKALSPLKPSCCRFSPTCSAYAKEAFLLHGVIKGAMLTFKRIIRCHPWGGFGYDPVPPLLKKDKK